MKLKDYVFKSIREYPSLYKDVDYEKSKLKVLNHTFFVTGNGLKIAYAKVKMEGGYITYPKFKSDNENEDGFRVRIFDEPYGKETFPSLPENYFENPIYTIYSSAREIACTRLHERIEIQYEKKDIDKYGEPRIIECKSNYPFIPSLDTRFNRILLDILEEKVFLQQDWLEALIFLCEKSIEFYNDYSQSKRHYYYPSNYQIKTKMQDFKDVLESNGVLALNDMQFKNGYKISDTLPDYKEVKAECRKQWEKHQNNQVEFLNSIISKFKSK